VKSLIRNECLGIKEIIKKMRYIEMSIHRRFSRVIATCEKRNGKAVYDYNQEGILKRLLSPTSLKKWYAIKTVIIKCTSKRNISIENKSK
jgi:hypothetical protein